MLIKSQHLLGLKNSKQQSFKQHHLNKQANQKRLEIAFNTNLIHLNASFLHLSLSK